MKMKSVMIIYLLFSIIHLIVAPTEKEEEHELQDIFDQIDTDEDGKINISDMETAIDNLSIFKYLKDKATVKEKFLKKFRENSQATGGKMDIENFEKTYSVLVILVDILPQGKTRYNKDLLEELLYFHNMEQINSILGGKTEISALELYEAMKP